MKPSYQPSPSNRHRNQAAWIALVAAGLVFLTPPTHSAPVPEDAVSPHFESVAKHLDLGGTMFAYIDIDGDLDSFASNLGEILKTQGAPPEITDLDLVKILRTLGVSQLSAIGLSSYQRGDRFHNKAFLHIPGGREGLFKAFGGEPGPLLAREIAPADTDLILEQDLDLKSVAGAIRNVLSSVGAKEMVREMDGAMGQSLFGPVTMGEFLKRGPSKVTIIGRINREKRIRIPGATDVAEFDVVVAFDGLGWLVRHFKALVPPEALAKVYIDGDGFEAFVAPESAPAPFGRYLPIAYVADGDDRLFIASQKEFLDECLSADGAILSNEDFKLATAGLPTEGNGLTYISPDITAEIRHLNNASGFVMGPSEIAIIQALGGEIAAELEFGIAHVSSNLPGGILYASNSVASHKSSLVTIPLVPLAIGASFAVPVFTKVTARAQSARNMNSAKQFLLGTHLFATDNDGNFPKRLKELEGDYIQPGVNLDWFDSDRESHSPWEYYGSDLNNSSPAWLMVLASPRPVGGSRIVGYLDGSVEQVSESEYLNLKVKLDAHLEKKDRRN